MTAYLVVTLKLWLVLWLTPSKLKLLTVLNNGFTAAYNGGDGVALFSYSHPLVSGGVNSNTPSTQADLNETSLENAVIQIAAWTDERGLLIAAKPTKLIVPPALQFVATRLLETELRVGTTDNDINAIKNNGSIPEGYTVNHFLTDTNAWFLTTDVPNGMKHFVRTPLSNSWTVTSILVTYVTSLVSVILWLVKVMGSTRNVRFTRRLIDFTRRFWWHS
jgi:hypothetical protein